MPIQSIGILVHSLNNSQNSYTLIQNINELISQEYMISPIIFFQFGSAPIIPIQCGQLQQSHAWGFDDILISTSIETTKVLTNCIRPRRKLFYVYDLEWYYQPPGISYKDLQKVYLNPEIDLIARSESHFELISKCWKKPIGVLHDYDYKEFIKIIEKCGN